MKHLRLMNAVLVIVMALSASSVLANGDKLWETLDTHKSGAEHYLQDLVVDGHRVREVGYYDYGHPRKYGLSGSRAPLDGIGDLTEATAFGGEKWLAIDHDASYFYYGGYRKYNSSVKAEWIMKRVSKKDESEETWKFGTSTTEDEEAEAIAVSSGAVYIGGFNYLFDRKEACIEVRNINDPGDLLFTKPFFNSDGVVDIETHNGLVFTLCEDEDDKSVKVILYTDLFQTYHWSIEYQNIVPGRNGLAVDDTGLYVAGSEIDPSGNNPDKWLIMKLSLEDGSQIWRRTLEFTDAAGIAEAVVAAHGAVFAAGGKIQQYASSWYIEKLDAPNGSVFWTKTPAYSGQATALDHCGDSIYVGGTTFSPSEWRTMRFLERFGNIFSPVFHYRADLGSRYPDRRYAMRFLNRSAGDSITNVKICNSGASGEAQFRVGIQGDEEGLPDGTYLVSNLVTPSEYESYEWITIPLTATPLDEGPYHIILEYAGNGVKGSWGFKCNTQKYSPIFPNDAVDPHAQVLSDYGSGWKVYSNLFGTGGTPIFLVEYAGNSGYGQPSVDQWLPLLDEVGNKWEFRQTLNRHDRLFDQTRTYRRFEFYARGRLNNHWEPQEPDTVNWTLIKNEFVIVYEGTAERTGETIGKGTDTWWKMRSEIGYQSLIPGNDWEILISGPGSTEIGWTEILTNRTYQSPAHSYGNYNSNGDLLHNGLRYPVPGFLDLVFTFE